MKVNKTGYLIKEGCKSIFTHGFMSFASVTIIIACLVIMGSFALLSVNIDEMIVRLEEENDIVCFVNEDLSLEDAQAIQPILETIDNVNGVTFVDRDTAFEDFIADYDPGVFEDMDSSVLRHRYIVSLNDITLMAQTEATLRSVDGIDDVRAHIDVANAFISVRNVVSVVSLIIVAILAVVSIFIMANTIKLASFGRREEIAIMKMVGATNSFIRLPFIIEGLILGLLGAIVAFFIEWGVYVLVNREVTGGIVGGLVEMIPFTELMYPVLGVFLGVGVVVGAFGSTIAIRNYLKV